MIRIAVIASIVGLCTVSVSAQNYVSGYVRNNGTYVQPYFRSSANSFQQDNYSFRGNTNPYTGSRGYTSMKYGSYGRYGSGGRYGGGY